MNRELVLSKIKNTRLWDVIVIGGGASGLGIALDAASRGYATLLVEQSDFAKGTSSRSTKLVHGGVRYLAQGNVRLVREASVERGLLAKNAPHLVKNQTFIIPVYSWWSRLKYTIGLKFYDWIAGRLSLGSSVFISRDEVIKKLPGIVSKNLIGGVLYHDGQFDDARLAINLAQTIFTNGGFAINYMRVIDVLKDDETVTGVLVSDVETDTDYLLRSKVVVNATGVFVDDILQMDFADGKKSISVSQGVHLVLDKSFFPGKDAMLIPETSDGRVLFVVPWHDKVLLGTTDTPVKDISLEPVAQQAEIDFILKTAAAYLTVSPRRIDIMSVFAGLRPLAAATKSPKSTKEISRSHKILVSTSGLFSIIGGKWTTYRKMGEDLMDRIEREKKWQHIPSKTASLKIHGYVETVDERDRLYYYGSDASAIYNLVQEEDDELVSEELRISKMQVIWAVREEMARTVEDFLSRRTRALLLDANESIRMATLVAKVMAHELNKDQRWIEEQLKKYFTVAQNYELAGDK